jgi:GTP:adenosylcobinamide-phosphate guanylyltransferase
MDAIVIAGGLPDPEDPLYPVNGGRHKALLDVAGEPMVQWVLEALGGSSAIDRVVVVGLPPESGITCDKPTAFLPNQEHMLDNIRSGVDEVLRQNPSARLALAVTSDIPAVTSETVDWVVETSRKTDHQLYYFVVERSLMEKRFPGSHRSYVRLKDAEVCGGDLSVVGTDIVADRRLWERLIAARKSAIKQASFLGWKIFLLLLLGQLTLERAESMVSRRMEIRGRVTVSPYAEIAMDVDKPYQLEILRKDLAARGRPGA